MNYYQLLKAYYDNQGTLPNTELSNMFASHRLIDFARSSESLSSSSVSPISSRSIATPPQSSQQKSPIQQQNIKINVNNIDKVSINVNKSNNNVKISCKTTPPKKRYSHKNDKNNAKLVMPVVHSTPIKNVTNTVKPISSSQSSHVMQRVVNKPFVKLEEDAITNPITSTYLNMTRSMGLSDDEALKLDQVVSDDIDYLHFDISKYL